ncbi:nuclear transport factor 2 family protein [Cetobacterium sp.]|uniref:nuclear transport factor 2 family protein n=1 Tax=Cetobacterium sp. TaxID=2071632 RepID=UPI003F40B72A
MERKYKNFDNLSKALDSKNTEVVLEYLTDNCIFQAGNIPAVQGKEAIKNIFDQFYLAVKSITHEITDIFESGDSVVQRGTVTYTRLDGSTLKVPVCDVLKISDNKIAEYYIYIDWSELF